MLSGAVVGAAIGAASSIATQVMAGQSVNWGEVGKQTAVGAVTGAISGLAGPEAGLLARGAIDTAASVGGQVVSNALEGKPLGDGVGEAAVNGALMSVGLGSAGKLLEAGAKRFFGSVAKEAEGEVAGGLESAAQCALSFAPETLVATPSGEQPIAQVKPGDAVTAYDPSTGAASTQTVTATSIHQDDNLVDVTLQVTTPSRQQTTATTGQATTASGAGNATSSAASVQTSTSHTEVVHTTTNHPWLTAEHGWLPAGFLHLGEPVRRADGSTATVAAIRVVQGSAAMWDLTVANVHTFAVGVGDYVVHNCGGGSPQTKELVEPELPKPASDDAATAYEKAHRHLGGPLGDDARPTTAKFGEGRGLQNGMQSADGQRGWRVDWDAEKGAHFNWYDWTGGGRGSSGRWGAVRFAASQEDVTDMALRFAVDGIEAMLR